jgi:hypothetical protein
MEVLPQYVRSRFVIAIINHVLSSVQDTDSESVRMQPHVGEFNLIWRLSAISCLLPRSV